MVDRDTTTTLAAVDVTGDRTDVAVKSWPAPGAERRGRSPSVPVGRSPDSCSRRRRRDHTPRDRQHRPQAVKFVPGRRVQAGRSVVILSRLFSRQSSAAETAAATTTVLLLVAAACRAYGDI